MPVAIDDILNAYVDAFRAGARGARVPKEISQAVVDAITATDDNRYHTALVRQGNNLDRLWQTYRHLVLGYAWRAGHRAATVGTGAGVERSDYESASQWADGQAEAEGYCPPLTDATLRGRYCRY